MINTIECPITPSILNMLLLQQDERCTSIYIPLFHHGEKVYKSLGQLHLKNAIKDVYKVFERKMISKHEASQYLARIESLLSDGTFWRNEADGLAIFTTKHEMHYYPMPIHFKPLTYVNNHYYITPLVPLMQKIKPYYVLSLSVGHSELYVANAYEINKVSIKEEVQEEIDQTEKDFEESLQFRSGFNQQKAHYHGQGEGKDDKNGWLLKYFKIVDEVVESKLEHKAYPLVLVCEDQYFAMYNELTSYPKVFNQFIDKNPKLYDIEKIHATTSNMVKNYWTKEQIQYAKQIRLFYGGKRVHHTLDKIVPAAVDGRIEALFIEKDTEQFGLYDEANRTVLLDDKALNNNASLINLITSKCMEYGGEVFLTDPHQLPIEGEPVIALLRY